MGSFAPSCLRERPELRTSIVTPLPSPSDGSRASCAPANLGASLHGTARGEGSRTKRGFDLVIGFGFSVTIICVYPCCTGTYECRERRKRRSDRLSAVPNLYIHGPTHRYRRLSATRGNPHLRR